MIVTGTINSIINKFKRFSNKDLPPEEQYALCIERNEGHTDDIIAGMDEELKVEHERDHLIHNNKVSCKINPDFDLLADY